MWLSLSLAKLGSFNCVVLRRQEGEGWWSCGWVQAEVSQQSASWVSSYSAHKRYRNPGPFCNMNRKETSMFPEARRRKHLSFFVQLTGCPSSHRTLTIVKHTCVCVVLSVRERDPVLPFLVCFWFPCFFSPCEDFVVFFFFFERFFFLSFPGILWVW